VPRSGACLRSKAILRISAGNALAAKKISLLRRQRNHSLKERVVDEFYDSPTMLFRKIAGAK
jgi:hypothetical protein